MKRVFGLIAMGSIAAAATSLVAFAADPAPTPTAEHKRLAFFVGEHTIEGKLANGTTFHATEKCDWFKGEFAVVCNTESGPARTFSAITYSPEGKNYGYFTISSSGLVGVQKGTLKGDVWTFMPDPVPGFPTAKIVVKPSPNGFLLTIDLEGKDGKFTQWEETKYTKK